ncbi:MAG: DUF922 domain-containing Zn-dependent protease [Gaiellaceae bacterium]
MRYFVLSLSLLLLLPSSAAALRRSSISHPQPGLTVETSTARYTIHGRTAAALRAQMNRLGPLDKLSGRRYDGYAHWNFYWNIRHRLASGKCRITRADVLIELKYTLPRWQRPAGVSTALVGHWTRYLGALRRHENGHGTLATRAGRKMAEKLRLLDPRASCSGLEAAADRAGEQGVARLNKAEAAYDVRTNHGATQGARFP